VEEAMRTQCVRCHAGSASAAGFSAFSWRDAIGCTGDGSYATFGDAPRIPAALARADHASVPEVDRARVLAWVAGGATWSTSSPHPRGYADPRSPFAHGTFLRARAYAPMRDANNADACGVCHEGLGRPTRVAYSVAPACTTCHADGPDACTTCHGAKAYPPRDPCFYPGERPGAHAKHVDPTALHERKVACTACRPGPERATHANGTVDRSCDTSCHARGGARPTPTWTDAPMGCNDCHASPPRAHYAGPCNGCHREASPDGRALVAAKLHANGRVDLGDGSGRCGACHGRDDDPWPTTGAHAAHARPSGSRPVACETCHEVPMGTHPKGEPVRVRLSGLAVRGGRRASYDPATKTCAGTYCHEGVGASDPAPRWDGRGACGSCHGAPPPPPHATRSDCAACHGGSEHLDGLLR